MSRPPDARPADAHVVQLYDDRRSLVESVTAYTRCALLHGEAALVVATPEHRTAFAAALAETGLALADLRRSGQYLELDAESLLAWATGRDGRLDVPLLAAALQDQLAGLAGRWRRVSAYSDLVACLWRRGDGPASVRLEHAWSRLADGGPVRLHCGYDSAGFTELGTAEQAVQVLTAHSAVRSG